MQKRAKQYSTLQSWIVLAGRQAIFFSEYPLRHHFFLPDKINPQILPFYRSVLSCYHSTPHTHTASENILKAQGSVTLYSKSCFFSYNMCPDILHKHPSKITIQLLGHT